MSIFLENTSVMLDEYLGDLSELAKRGQDALDEYHRRTTTKKKYNQYDGTFWGGLITSDILNKT
jgi:hypothetical protein